MILALLPCTLYSSLVSLFYFAFNLDVLLLLTPDLYPSFQINRFSSSNCFSLHRHQYFWIKFIRIWTCVCSLQALAAADSSDWAAGSSYANSAFMKCMHLHSYVLSHIHDTVVTAATTSMDTHNNTHVKESIIRNLVEETDLGDEDSFAYFYTKFLFVCGSLFIACFNGVKRTVKYYKNRRILM